MKKANRDVLWLFAALVCLSITSAQASEWKDKAEAEGKLSWYASLGATDARRIIDRFKELYPKIDAQFYRAGDAQLMERIPRRIARWQVRLGRGQHYRLLCS